MKCKNLLIQRASKLLPLLQGDFRQLSTPSCFAKIAVRPSTLNLKNPLQITSSRVKQLVQKLASTLANRYENWCVTNFAGTNTKKLDPLWLKLERYIQAFILKRRKYVQSWTFTYIHLWSTTKKWGSLNENCRSTNFEDEKRGRAIIGKWVSTPILFRPQTLTSCSFAAPLASQIYNISFESNHNFWL